MNSHHKSTLLASSATGSDDIVLNNAISEPTHLFHVRCENQAMD